MHSGRRQEGPLTMCRKNLRDPFCRFTIPQRWKALRFVATLQSPLKVVLELFPISSYQDIRARSDGDGALGILAQSEAWHSEVGGLLLNSARVSNDNLCILLKRK